MIIDAKTLDFKQLNEKIRACTEKEITVEHCMGQRYIASGLKEKRIVVRGVAGNATAAYLDGADVEVFGNAQDAMGDTMNAGTVFVHGSTGDAVGYAMRGGKIFVKGDTGYRAGIHMKAYGERIPSLVIGGSAGSFLGEYQAGGRIVVLGIGKTGAIVGNFCGTGMHGGQIYLRSTNLPPQLPAQVSAALASPEDIEKIRSDVETFAKAFGYDADELLKKPFFVLTPNTQNPYRQMYTHN